MIWISLVAKVINFSITLRRIGTFFVFVNNVVSLHPQKIKTKV